MTEIQWLECDDPMRMPVWLGGSDRRLRLLACACCRENWTRLTGSACRRAMDLAEEFADWNVHQQDLARSRVAAFYEAVSLGRQRPHIMFGRNNSTTSALHFFAADSNIVPMPSTLSFWEEVFIEGGPFRLIGSQIIREIFGNPFHPVTLDRRWLSSTVRELARTICDEKVWERMPILSDALMDAGCDHEEIITHCRGPGPHVRGCWAVDLILGKE